MDANLKIDLNRGVTYQVTREGVKVFVYVDDPCQFLSVHGHPVSEDLARNAGFDVEAYKKKCAYKQRLADAADAIRAELEADVDEETHKVVEERQGFKVISLGMGRAKVVDPDGAPLHKEGLTEEQAKKLLVQLTPEKPKK